MQYFIRQTFETEEEVAKIKLPNVSHLVSIFLIDKIMKPRAYRPTVEKLNLLENLKHALETKLQRIQQGREIKA